MANYGVGRAMREGAALQRLGTSVLGTFFRTAEVALAAPLVVAARASRMHDSAADPLQVENLRMVTEKIEAAMLTGGPMLKGVLAWQREAFRIWQEVSADGLRNVRRLNAARSPAEVQSALGEAWQTAAIRAQSAALRAGRGQAALASGLLAPYNRRVSGNARRLHRRSR